MVASVPVWWPWTRCADRLQFPEGVEVKQAGLGCLVMSSPGPDRCGRVRAWSDPAQPAVPNHIVTTRLGVMPICGLDCWLRPSVTLG